MPAESCGLPLFLNRTLVIKTDYMDFETSDRGEANGRTEVPKIQPMQRPINVTALSVLGLFILGLFYTFYFAREFILENKAGAPTLKALRRIGAAQEVETVGAKLRDMMPWIKKNRLVDQSKN